MNTITVYTSCHWDIADSYGLIACQLARHLTALGARVNAVSLKQTVLGTQPDDVRAVTSRPILPSLGGIALGYPTNYRHHSGLFHAGPKVAVTMFESSKLPDDWQEPLNRMDAVIVPSRFCAETFRASGITAPIHVVPLGVGDSYQYKARTGDRPLTFLAFMEATRGARKGGITALQSFLRAFGEDMKYKLILKGRVPRVPFTLTNPNIEVIFQDMSEAEMYELYCRCDILINPHKGEGFGLIPREFAATGGLAMTTNWSGTADDLPKWGHPLPYTLERADWKGNRTLQGREVGEWASLDPDRVATQLRIVADNWDWYKKHLPAKAAAACELYSWRAFGERVLAIWSEVANGYANRAAAA